MLVNKASAQVAHHKAQQWCKTFQVNRKKPAVFQRNNFIRFHFLHWVDSSPDIWLAIHWSVQCLNSLKWQVKNTSFVQSSLKTSLASDILFLSKWLNTSMRFWNLFLMHQDYKSHTKNMIKRQYNQSKQTLELWKRHLTNSLFLNKEESKSSLHTQDFHQVQQEPQRVQQRHLTGKKHCWTESFAVSYKYLHLPVCTECSRTPSREFLMLGNACPSFHLTVQHQALMVFIRRLSAKGRIYFSIHMQQLIFRDLCWEGLLHIQI